MFERKKRILFVSEASYSDTGFGRYYYELISRLVRTNKYDIAELGCWGTVNHPKDQVIKWKYYANQPNQGSDEEKNYNSNSNNKVGLYRFDKVAIDFLPDIVISMRDIAMDFWISSSPLRKYFTWIIAPPVDSAPQSNDFLASYYEADGIVPYTEYGYDVISKEAPGANLICANYPGLNSDIFKPLDQKECRAKYEFPKGKRVIGMVSRNQIRKLFPSLIRDFAKFLEKSGRDDIILYLHTTFPDLKHWDLPKYLLESGVQDKVYFTTVCDRCRKSKASLWITDNIVCDNCGKKSVAKLKLNNGPSIEELNELYNCLDLYIHLASSEGLSVTSCEAAMVGVPIMATNYSALENVLEKVGGIKLSYLALLADIHVGADRAIPDPEATVCALTSFFKKSDSEHAEIRNNTLKRAREAFSPDNNAKIWEEIIDSIETKKNWNLPHENIPNVDINLEQFKTCHELVYSIINNILPDEPIANSYLIDETLIRAGNRGYIFSGGKGEIYNAKNIVQWLENYIRNKKGCENLRCGLTALQNEDYLEYAESKEICHI